LKIINGSNKKAGGKLRDRQAQRKTPNSLEGELGAKKSNLL
jgi:hypothetical protein